MNILLVILFSFIAGYFAGRSHRGYQERRVWKIVERMDDLRETGRAFERIGDHEAANEYYTEAIRITKEI